MGRTVALVCTLAVLAAVSPAKARGDPCGSGHLRRAEVRGGVLELRWEGRIVERMAEDIAVEFAEHKRNAKSVTLSLTSCGGGGLSMERAIYVLRDIKASHALTTVVERGAICASACVPVFLAGGRRIGALASLWYFHPPTRVEDRADKAAYLEEFIHNHFPPTVVSPDWVHFMRRSLRNSDLWQTGRDLWESKSGILTETLDNVEPREGVPLDLPNGTACGLLCRG